MTIRLNDDVIKNMVNVNEMVYDKRNEFVVLWFQGNRQDGVWSEEND